MIAKNLISEEIPTIKNTDTGSEVLALMGVYHLQHLPIVENHQFIGIISEEDIYQDDDNATLESYKAPLTQSYINEDDHIFEVMSTMAKNKLTIIPVINSSDKYIGSITLNNLMHYYANSYAFIENGSILVLETTKNNYSLVEISSIVEQEHAVILGTHLSSDQNSNLVQITLKINKSNIGAIVASFERYGYTIIGSFYEDENFNNLKNRYDSLMNYLSI